MSQAAQMRPDQLTLPAADEAALIKAERLLDALETAREARLEWDALKRRLDNGQLPATDTRYVGRQDALKEIWVESKRKLLYGDRVDEAIETLRRLIDLARRGGGA